MRLTSTIYLTPEELAELDKLALQSLPAWARKEIERLRALTATDAEPIGFVSGEQIAARAVLPIMHYTSTDRFDTPVFLRPSPYWNKPATGVARETDGVKLDFVADCLRSYARILRDGLIDGAGHYFPVDIDEAADGLDEIGLGNEAGWIVTSGDGERFRTWKDGMSAWVSHREEATRYARRVDAEAVHAEDEDAWCIVPYADEHREVHE